MHIHIIYIHASEESMTSSNLTYGLASRDRIAAMTGKQILQAIIEGEFPQAPISRALSFWIVGVSDGFAAFEGEPGQHLLNPMGAVHGGWALTLIDSVTACAGYPTMLSAALCIMASSGGRLSALCQKRTSGRSMP